MRKVIKFFILLWLAIHCHCTSFSQCYPQLDGRGLFLYSPVKTRLTLYKPLPGKEWGDSVITKCMESFRPVYYRRVSPGYILKPGTEIYATHSGIIRIFTTGGNNEPNDACWIDGGNFSTAYFHVYFTVNSNQFIFAGQRIGTVIPRSDTTFFYFGIRQSAPMQPNMKRVALPIEGDKECSCYISPFWPEYFVNPTDLHIYWEYNNTEPSTSIKVALSPSWAGKWSFDEGKTWLGSGETVNGLPQKHYKIIFKDKDQWKTPVPIEFTSNSTQKNYDFSFDYIPEKVSYKMLKQADASIVDSADFMHAIDSVREIAYDSSYKNLRAAIYTTFRDSLKSKILNIELEQKKAKFLNKVTYYVVPLSFLLALIIIVFVFQYQKIKKQKRYVEELQKELHHRVRNNLGIISALVDASAAETDKKFSSKDLESRIKSISLIHEQLYQQEDVSALNFGEFLQKLCDSLIHTYAAGGNTTYIINAPLKIEAKLATQIALVIAEIIRNSLKHAGDSEKELQINIEAKLSGKKIHMKISDDGNGFPDNFGYSKKSSYGIQMIQGLIRQLKGEIKFYNQNGAVVELII